MQSHAIAFTLLKVCDDTLFANARVRYQRFFARAVDCLQRRVNCVHVNVHQRATTRPIRPSNSRAHDAAIDFDPVFQLIEYDVFILTMRLGNITRPQNDRRKSRTGKIAGMCTIFGPQRLFLQAK